MTNNERITVIGTALAAPTTTPDRIAEFPVQDVWTGREYLVRIAADGLDTPVIPGARVEVHGETGWTVPGRSWRGEASRTLLQAQDVAAGELLLAA
ncbi:hypothetical protein [Curtobacterium sp. ISL-83]|uniref:hypothetical protein n=1 Tax=Curtobacterium sp. ISL-83 TaxID=2819145 RepID=UPI001BE59BE8|nr:hypothetical protein [Curtobacterium sp. ISL-83]MBT2501431.1 hypothetical protein [Curtobacterium sp. ISL-83]